MGKYRILLVVISFIIIYVDTYINVNASSLFVSCTIFFAMLLYDYEKLRKNFTNRFDQIFANIGCWTYLTFFGSSFILMITSFNNITALKATDGFWSMQIVFGSKSLNFSVFFLIVFIFVFVVTLVEINRDTSPQLNSVHVTG